MIPINLSANLPDKNELIEAVNILIIPETADRQVRALSMIVLAVAGGGDKFSRENLECVLNTAYAKTEHCEDFIRAGFKDFLDLMMSKRLVTEKDNIEKGSSYEVIG